MKEAKDKKKPNQTAQKSILEQSLKRTMTTKMQQLEDQVLAEAIRSMLLKGEEDTPTFH